MYHQKDCGPVGAAQCGIRACVLMFGFSFSPLVKQMFPATPHQLQRKKRSAESRPVLDSGRMEMKGFPYREGRGVWLSLWRVDGGIEEGFWGEDQGRKREPGGMLKGGKK